MRKLKLLFAAAALMLGVGTASAQSWTAPTITSEAPVSGTTYKVYNVGASKYLAEGRSWFSWSTTAIGADNGSQFTFTGDASSFTLTTIRSGNNKVFTSGNSIAGDAMHVDGANATNYGLYKLPNGNYRIHDAGGNESSPCWGYGVPSGQTVAGVVAHADANADGWNCEWAFLTDASFTLFDARVNLYNLLLKAYGEGANTDAASEVYNNANSTLEQINTAYNNLNQARYAQALASASNDTPKNITEWVLTNPDFSAGNINGWETNYVSGQQAQNIGYQGASYTNGGVTISQFIEAWRPGATLGDGYLRQIVSGLPEGKYVLEADGISVWQNDASRTVTGSQIYITADGVDYYTNMSTANNKPEHFSVQFLNSGEGDVIFGLRTVSSNGNWLCADNFKVTFYGIDLSAYATQLANEVTTFEGYKSSVDATVYASLQTQVNTLNTTYNSSKAYAAAIAHMQAINAYAAELIAANAIDQKAKMNATVLQSLQGAISASVDASNVNALTTATADLNTAITNANTSIANYVEAKAILDAANIYDADGQANYAANETIAAIQAAYDNGTLEAVTNEQKAAAQAALANACKAQTQPANNCDMTAFIVNPNFDSNANGWTTEKLGNGWTAEPYNGNNHNIEYWSPSVIDANVSTRFFDYYQTITSLPKGAYTVSASMLNATNNEENEEGHEAVDWNGGGNAGVYGKNTSDNEQRALITINDQTFRTYTTGEIFVIDGNLRIGVKNINPLTGRWFAADNFKLTYVRQLTAEEIEEIEKPTAVAAYNEALAAAQAIAEGSVPDPVYTNLQTVISENTLNDGSANEYNAAAAALNEAATAAQALVTPYAAWKALKPQADALVAVSTNDTEKKTTLSSAISTENAKVEVVNTTADAITTATAALKDAMVTYVTTAEPTNDECFDLTFMIVNPHFTEGNADNPTGWTVNYPAAPEGQWGGNKELRASTHNFEAYHKQFTLSQTIPGLSKGTYKVTLQGFARHDGDDKNKTNLFCGIVNQPIKNISDEYSTTPLTSGKPAMGDNNGESSYIVGEETRYQPNGMSGSYYFFQEINPATNQPFYTSEVQTLMTDNGDLTIGFKCETWSDWVIWDNFHLYYYGSAIAVTIDENKAGSVYEHDIENANVTLNRTFNAGKWNTIALPFDLSDAETKAAFGNGAQVATFSESLTNNNLDSKVTFTIAADASITANTPVLLKTSTTETIFKFNGKTIKAGEAKAEGGHYFDFVGTYAASTTIAEGDYFIGDNQLWKSEGATTIKGTRAYFKAKDPENGARIANFCIGDSGTTGIVTIDNGVKSIDNAMFDLQGRKVENVKKGLYIKNSKKVVVR